MRKILPHRLVPTYKFVIVQACSLHLLSSRKKTDMHPRSMMSSDVHAQETSNLEPVTTETTRTNAERETKAVTLAAEALCDAWIGYQNELVPDIFFTLEPHLQPSFEPRNSCDHAVFELYYALFDLSSSSKARWCSWLSRQSNNGRQTPVRTLKVRSSNLR